MAIRLHEAHPSLVHFPLSFLPLSVAADAAGEVLDRDDLRQLGRLTMPLAAGAAAVAGVSGLVAQQEVEGSDHAFDMLITHRNLNLLVGSLAAGLAGWRWGRDRVGAGYLAAAVAGIGTMFYSAWVGGEMVYSHGMGVRAAGGVREDVPELSREDAGRAASRTAENLVEGGRLTAEETAEGSIAPSVGGEH
ncbi:MAG: DUF2231 domain-containing protein [Gemmatimonadota bacterium]